jgi:hypothetical protein
MERLCGDHRPVVGGPSPHDRVDLADDRLGTAAALKIKLNRRGVFQREQVERRGVDLHALL